MAVLLSWLSPWHIWVGISFVQESKLGQSYVFTMQTRVPQWFCGARTSFMRNGCSCPTVPTPFEISSAMELFMCSWWMTWSYLQCVPMVAQMEFECLSLHQQVKVSSLLINSALVTPTLWSARSSWRSFFHELVVYTCEIYSSQYIEN